MPRNSSLLCHYCGEPAIDLCGNCLLVRYCCTDCQRKSWIEDEHRTLCPVLVTTDDGDCVTLRLADVVLALRQLDSDGPVSVDGHASSRHHYRAGRSVTLSRAKARKILHDGSVRGHPLTERQRRYFGWIATR